MANNSTEEDPLLLMMIGMGMLFLAPTALILEPVRAWAISNGVFVTGESVVLQLWDGAGLDIWRLVIAAAVVITALALIVTGIRKKQKETRRV
ncbi:hypothetical protein F6W69_18820 [Microbacterium oxydans]|uniref:hypothetical protein n=1 Tax=Microbacterium oxydans TaxID=82380 RepID=UPI001144FF60|nr:hypothetical protein [Microbacterium oxydans]KAB1888808.1 hypothetical protein F6W69_18820 [Microbacterium oxydans]